MELKIFHEQNRSTGTFYIKSNCEKLAYIAYQENPGNCFRLTHTFVDPSLRGQNIASKLTEEVVTYARKNEIKLVPVCPYLVQWFERNPEKLEGLWLHE